MQRNQPPLRIGITGNMGSGKTTVCRLFELLGIPVYYADAQAKRLMQEDDQLAQAIRDLLGNEAYFDDGRLNRAYIAERVFTDATRLAKLNALVHPAVRTDGDRWHTTQTGVPYTLYEAALLYESGHAAGFAAVIVVAAPEEIRLERVIARDHTTRAAALARMHKQWPEERKKALADYVIHNNGQQSLIRQVWQLHHLLCELHAAMSV